MRLQARDNLSTPVGEKMVSLFNSIKIQRRKRKIEIQRNMKVTWVAWKCSLKTALTLFLSLLHLAERNMLFTHSLHGTWIPSMWFNSLIKAKQRERGRKQNDVGDENWKQTESGGSDVVLRCSSVVVVSVLFAATAFKKQMMTYIYIYLYIELEWKLLFLKYTTI